MTRLGWTSVLIAMALSFSVSALRASDSDFEFHVVAKKVGEKASKVLPAKMGRDPFGQPKLGGGGTVLGKEEWAYEVTIENKTFHDMAGLEVKYAVFYKKNQIGFKADAGLDHEDGSFPLPALRAHEKGSFTTESVSLKNGGHVRAQNALVGVAVRVYQNGQPLAEFANLSTLLKEFPN